MCQELSSNMGRGKTSRLGSLSSVFSSFPIICCSNGSSISKRSNRSSIKQHEKQDISKKLKEHKMYEKKIGHSDDILQMQQGNLEIHRLIKYVGYTMYTLSVLLS